MSDLTRQQFGNYRLIRLLGQGGFADTYLGEQIYLRTYAAMKIVQTQLAQDDQGTFFREAQTIAYLRHPNIVRLLDFGVESSRNIPYLVMDYAPNGTLRQRHSRGEVLPVSRVVPYVKQIAAALQYAHDHKVIHRDVKPENMLVGAENEILLADFGIAVVESSRIQTQSTIAGTMNYMAPEQIRGKPIPASDQYALAVVVYEWLCGRPPFTGSYTEMAIQHECGTPPPLRERVATIPTEVEQVVLTALAKDSQQRFKDVQTFAYALEQASNMGSSPSLNPSLADSQMDIPTVHMPYTSPAQGSAGSSQVSAEQAAQTAYGPQPVDERGSPSSASAGSIPVPPPPPPDPRNPHTPPPLVHESFEPRTTPQFTHPLNTPQHAPVQDSAQGSYTSPQGSSAAPPPLPGQARSTSSASFGSSHRRRPSGRLLLLLGAIVIVLLILGGSFFAYTTFYPPTPGGQAKTTAQAYASATATARQDIYRQATSGTPIISDALSTPDNYGWSHYQDQTGYCTFVDGTYHSRAQVGYIGNCYASATNFTDFAYQVEVTIISGTTGGIWFRNASSANYDAYYFYIHTDGRYDFLKETLNAQQTYDATSLAGGTSPTIRRGLNQPNLVAAVARGSTFYFYVNKQYVTIATDNSYKSGAIGVSANSTDTSGSEASFRNLQVWQL
ncbi:MAG: serine/threonine protein kinase [Chloroflexi bacterium]|nr:MAG: serine/threonine protein kinase [Chloroflexota bacterium]